MAIAATEAVNNRRSFSPYRKPSHGVFRIREPKYRLEEGWGVKWELAEQFGIVLNNSFAGEDTGGKAKETVWSKPEKFNQLMLQMNQGFTELQKASIEWVTLAKLNVV